MQSLAAFTSSWAYEVEITRPVQVVNSRSQEASFGYVSCAIRRVGLCLLEIEVPKCTTSFKSVRSNLSLWGKLIGCVFSSAYLRKRAAFLKHAASKLPAPWNEYHSKFIATLKDAVMWADNCGRQLDYLESLTTLPRGLTNSVYACLHHHMSNVRDMRERMRQHSIVVVRGY